MIERVYLMTDHSSSSLWAEGFMVDPRELGVSEETTRALRAWSEMEEQNFDAEVMNGEPAPFPIDVYMAEGLRLWRIVREELAGRCEVGFAFFDEHPDDVGSAKRIEWDPDMPMAQWPQPTS
jgi:hypothetical protein